MSINLKDLFDEIRRIKLAGGPDTKLLQGDVDRVGAILKAGTSPTPVPVIVKPPLVVLPRTGMRELGDPDDFFAAVRNHPSLFGGKLNQSQVDGMSVKLAAFATAGWSTAWAADALATSFLESNKTMQPVEEAYYLGSKAAAWRKKNLRYYPWYGRGDVQLTWIANYTKADAELAKAGLIKAGALLANPELALVPQFSAFIMVKGMEQGWFTTKSLKTYLPNELGTRPEFKSSRRIINGTDRNDDLATYSLAFQDGLVDGDWRVAA